MDYPIGGANRNAGIRLYQNKPLCHLLPELPGRPGQHQPFPVIASYPSLSHLSFLGEFAAPQFTHLAADSPWAFFDPAGNTFIVSPASDYLVAAPPRCQLRNRQRHLDGYPVSACGINALHRARMGQLASTKPFERWAGR